MPVELVNDHVLLPFLADWSEAPRWSRQWHTEVVDAVTGAESRQALRTNPRVSLRYLISPGGQVSTQLLDDILRAALKSGLACCPMWGRGGELLTAVDALATEVQLSDTWPWQAGDYLFLGDENGADVRLVTDADLAGGVWTLTLDSGLVFDHAGGLGWPVLFGKFAAGDVTAASPTFGPVQVTVTEIVSGRTAQVGAVVPDAGAGIGAMAMGSTFEVA
jgi:hypothetical protein